MVKNQELYYPAIMRAIAATNYDGYVGQEFSPVKDASKGTAVEGMQRLRKCVLMLGRIGMLLGLMASVTQERVEARPIPPQEAMAQLAGYRTITHNGEQDVLDSDGLMVGTFMAMDSDSVQAEDKVEVAGPALMRWRRTFRLKPGQNKQRVRLTMDFRAAYKSRFAMIPGISFNGNSGDPGNVYHGFTFEGTPWSFAWHRTLIPGATYSEGEKHTVALYGEVGDPRIGLACSLLPAEQTTTHRLIFPEEEMPRRVLVREKGLSPGQAKELELQPGQTFQATAWLVLHPVEKPRLGYRTLLDIAWRQKFHTTVSQRSAEELWTMGVRYAREGLWDKQAQMFQRAMCSDDKGHWQQSGGFEIGWCGRNGDLANALLADYLRRQDPVSRDIGIACLDTWAAKAGAQYKVSGQEVRVGTPGSVPVAVRKLFIGCWKVVYNNASITYLNFLPNGRIGDSPYWGTGTLRVTADGLGCDWARTQQETYRLTPEGQLAVEHRFQGVLYTGVGTRYQGPDLYKAVAGDANNLAAGATAFFRAAPLAEQCGLHRPQYRALALALCDAVLAVQQQDGHFEAACFNKGSIGATFIPPLLTAYEVTKAQKYLRGAIAANTFYLGQFYHDGSVRGSSLDTQSIDYESIAPLLEGNLRLYEHTGEAKYLTQAEDAAYYDAAWQMAQSIPNPAGSWMETIHYDTFGTHGVATVHMCAHAFGLADFRSLWRLAQITHKSIWRERAIAVWNNATFGISDGADAPMGETMRPFGSQDETYGYTDWGMELPWVYHVDIMHPRGNGSEWLVAWPTAMRLTILADPELRTAIETLPVKPLRL